MTRLLWSSHLGCGGALLAAVIASTAGCGGDDAAASPTTNRADGGAGGSAGSGGDAQGGAGGTAADCGDGVTEGEEECDDGNLVDSDGCNADCRPSGQLLWATTVNFREGNHYATGVAELSDGRFVMAGSAPDAVIDGASDIAIALIDASGNELSKQSIDGSGVAESGGGKTDHGRRVLAMPDGGFVVVGYEFVDDPNVVTTAGEHPWIRRHDAAGEAIWTKQAPTVPRGRCASAALSGEVVYVGGNQQSVGWLRAYTEGGAELWSANPDGGGSSCNGCQGVGALTAVPGGGVAAAMTLVGATDKDAWTTKMTSDSTEQWADQYDDGQDERAIAIGADADDNVIVLATRNGGGAFVRKYDGAGDLVWHLDDPVTTDGYDSSLAVAPDGGFVIVGTAYPSSTDQDAVVTRFDADGSKLWQTFWSHDDASLDGGAAVAFTSTGQVVMVGRTAPSGSTEGDMFIALLAQ